MLSNKPLDQGLVHRRFVERLARNGILSVAVVVVSMGIGTTGFKWVVGQTWSLAFLNAAMLLGGMGPVGPIENAHTGGKIFAAMFALYAGLVFLIIAGLLLAPVFHRVLHHFHWEIHESE